MQTQINYEDFITPQNTQIIKQITAELSQQIQLVLEVTPIDTTTNGCNIKLVDKIGVGELDETITKEDVRELIELLKRAYMQL